MNTVALFGAGLMGQRVAELLQRWPDVALAAVVSRNRPEWLRDVPWYPNVDELSEITGFLIDFSLPGGTGAAARWCRANMVPMISGTTGLEEADREALEHAAELVPVLWAPNLSRGLNLVLRSVVEAAASLPRDIPVRITDVHHVHKKDQPSGTALLLAHAIASARGVRLEDCLVLSMGSDAPRAGMVQCVSHREGEAVGAHRVTFYCRHEQIEFSHDAEERDIYAAGAIEAGFWLLKQPAGLYSAAEWLAPPNSAV